MVGSERFGVASHSALGTCVGDTFLSACDEEIALPLSERGHHVDDHLVSSLGGVESRVKHADVDITLGEVGDGCYGFAHGAPKTVETGHDEGVTRSHARERLLEAKTLPFAARHGVGKEVLRVAAHVKECIALGV